MRMSMLAAAALLVPLSGFTQTPPPVRTITLYSYGYAPDPIHLTADEPVTLRFVNRAGKGHDFTAEGFFRSARLIAGAPRNGEIDLDAGESVSVTLVPERGTYKVHCGRVFHKQLGMHGTIVVH